jgi:NAD+ synthase (glutamine-hydrolysing)
MKLTIGKPLVNKLLACAYQGTDKLITLATLQSAQHLAESLGADFIIGTFSWKLIPTPIRLKKHFNRKTTWEKDDISLQNIQARARSPIIWMLATLNKPSYSLHPIEVKAM